MSHGPATLWTILDNVYERELEGGEGPGNMSDNGTLPFSVSWTPSGSGLMKPSGEKESMFQSEIFAFHYLAAATWVFLLSPKHNRHAPVPRFVLCHSSMKSVFSRVHRLIPLLPSRPFKVDLPHYPSTTFNFRSSLPLCSTTHIPFLFCLT